MDGIRVGLIHSGGQNPDGSMSAETLHHCALAVEHYNDASKAPSLRIGKIMITTAETVRGISLMSQMCAYLTQNGVLQGDIITLPKALTPEQALETYHEWARDSNEKPTLFEIGTGVRH